MPSIQKVFYCQVCQSIAGSLEMMIERTNQGKTLTITGFNGKIFFQRKFGEAFTEAIRTGNLPTLYQLDSETVPFYCPECDRCYCRRHWQIDNGWHITGTCPKKHHRIIGAGSAGDISSSFDDDFDFDDD